MFRAKIELWDRSEEEETETKAHTRKKRKIQRRERTRDVEERITHKLVEQSMVLTPLCQLCVCESEIMRENDSILGTSDSAI